MSKRKRQTRQTTQPLPDLAFTTEQLRLLQRTLKNLEPIARRQPKHIPKRDLAIETIVQVQRKIDHMIKAGNEGEAVMFDGNETLILQTSVWIFSLSVETFVSSPEKEQLLQACQTISLMLLPSLQKAHLFNE